MSAVIVRVNDEDADFDDVSDGDKHMADEGTLTNGHLGEESAAPFETDEDIQKTQSGLLLDPNSATAQYADKGKHGSMSCVSAHPSMTSDKKFHVKWRQLWYQYCQETTLHGLKQITEPQPFIARR